jgi:Protein of unknown function (DUF2800)
MSHAKLSPSAAERWMTCPGSIVLSEGMPNKSSKFADEGTMAHALGEMVLTNGEDACEVGVEFHYEDHGEDKLAVVTQEMADHLQVYIDHVRELGGEFHCEQRVHVNEHVYGTADAVVWQEDEKHLHIVDLKYGAGVAVEVHGNLQLKIYALATLLTFGYPAKQVTATIVQPRCPHSDGPVRSATFDVVDLLDFHADLEDAVARVAKAREDFQDEFDLTPSEKGCRWCLAAPKCPKLKSKAQEMAKRAFTKDAPYDAAELAETLDYLPILEGWIKNVREFAYEEAERGSTIPQWKLVEKRATRKWRGDESVVVNWLQEKTDLATDDLYDEPSLKTPAAIEKLLPKEQRALLDELCVKESSGHTLVHESDKRPAIKVDAKSAFANL